MASSSSSPPSTVPAAPLSLEGLLAAHSSDPNPHLAALDQALSERNLLSSQNSQLWKLIEKQRAGYNQILKELERVRNERDTYKARLSVVGGSTGNVDSHRDIAQKRQVSRDGRERDRAITLENTPATQENLPRRNMTRYNSDDLVTPRPSNHSQTLHSSRSQEPISNNSSSSSLTSSLPPPPSSAPSRQKSPLAPLVVPPRTETLPQVSATQEYPPQSLPSAEAQPADAQKYTHYTHGYNDSIMSSLSYASRTQQPSPQNYPRKGSLSESINSIHSSVTSSSSLHTPASAIYGAVTERSSQSPQDTPQTAPPGYETQAMYTPQTATPSSSIPYPPDGSFGLHDVPEIQTSLATPTAAAAVAGADTSSLQSAAVSHLSPSNLSQTVSRDSRITLPDEAKQYIANMGESPYPSPRVDTFNTPKAPSAVHNSSARDQQTTRGGLPDRQEFLDLDDEDGDANDGPEDEASSVHTSLRDGSPEDTPLNPPSHTPVQPTHSASSSDIFVQGPPRKSSSIQQHAGSEDFPPPPSLGSISHYPHPQKDVRHEHNQHHQLLEPPSYTSLRSSSDTMSTSSAGGVFRALPLLSSDLPHTKINVSHSFVRPNDRGKEVLSFVVHVDPGRGKEGWKVEKLYSDVLNLDQRVRSSVGKSVGKKIAALPEGKLWKDHAPAKVDQRKAVLEGYLQSLIKLPVKGNDEVVAFFTTDIVRETMQPVMQAGHKEGYLTKRGKNFGGWKTRYFVLQGPVLEYFDCRGGTHLGSINVAGAQIGRQQRNPSAAPNDDEKEYRHAFLIVEAKKGPGGNHPRHVLCAESDAERDSWVEILVRYFSGLYSEEPVSYGSSSNTSAQSRPSVSNDGGPRKPVRGLSRDDITISKGAAIPLSHLPQDANNAKLFQMSANNDEHARPSSPSNLLSDRLPITDSQTAKRILDRSHGQPSSLPDSSPLSNGAPTSSQDHGQRANSEMGHYPDMQPSPRQQRHHSPERHRQRDQQNKIISHLNGPDSNSSPTASSPSERIPSPEKLEASNKVKISGPLNGAPIPAGYKFGGKDAPSDSTSTNTSSSDRREKAKSRSFWGFGRPNGSGPEKVVQGTTFAPRAVFGVPLEESLDVAQIANLPAIVFRCIQYLESKKADQEEGIYRLSGSSAVIKSLKDRFNMEGDVDLIASDEYWDPHAIAGLLKSYLRELPASILTRELHVKFLAVIDFVDPQERIRELSRLIGSLPIANYSLLRALTAHLILIVQNSAANKMTMRNVGIVFSPTLGIPAGVFSLMLGEFNRVFNVDGDRTADNDNSGSAMDDQSLEPDRRNSRQYSEAAADELLGLGGRTLAAPPEDSQSDTDELSSVQEESGTEGDLPPEGSSESSPTAAQNHATPPDTPLAPTASRASHVAAARGLNINLTPSDRGNRHSRIMGLPTSPRPPPSPASPSQPLTRGL
ncbi:Rho GTPase activating protein [Paramarasmius palmivorus]|uniref:Rho GTPase activating protein n=1 Tax=Paramarasmius palmivorus TaxID=297713 RepID=A0AAW0DZ39_9AGAR